MFIIVGTTNLDCTWCTNFSVLNSLYPSFCLEFSCYVVTVYNKICALCMLMYLFDFFIRRVDQESSIHL